MLRRMFCEVGRLGTASVNSKCGKPWFSCSSDPGSSAGKPEDDGTELELERGRPGRGLCTNAEPGQAVALIAGERSISLKIAMRLDVELTRAPLNGEDRGLVVNCWLSGGIMVRLEGGLRLAFWVFLQQGQRMHAQSLEMMLQLPCACF